MVLNVTTVQGKRILRVCIGGTQTRKSHVEAAWQRIAKAGAAARS